MLEDLPFKNLNSIQYHLTSTINFDSKLFICDTSPTKNNRMDDVITPLLKILPHYILMFVITNMPKNNITEAYNSLL